MAHPFGLQAANEDLGAVELRGETVMLDSVSEPSVVSPPRPTVMLSAIAVSSSPVVSGALMDGPSMTASTRIDAPSLAEPSSVPPAVYWLTVATRPVRSTSLFAGGEKVGPPEKFVPAGSVIVQVPVAEL